MGALGRELQQTQEDSRAGAQGGDRGGAMKSEQWGDQRTERYWPGLHTPTSRAPSQEGS